MNYYPITILDDFLIKPDKLRKYALNQSFYTVKDFSNFNIHSTFPGWRTKDLKDINIDLYKKLFSKVMSIFHPNDYDQVNWKIESYFQSVPKIFKEGVIHDDGNTLLAGVLYLHPNPTPNSGTSIYKKNDLFNEDAYVAGTKKNNFKTQTVPDIAYHNMFTSVMDVENVYNRMIIYEGNEFHRANNFFGETINDSRLTLVFFIKNIKANNLHSFPKNRIRDIQI